MVEFLCGLTRTNPFSVVTEAYLIKNRHDEHFMPHRMWLDQTQGLSPQPSDWRSDSLATELCGKTEIFKQSFIISYILCIYLLWSAMHVASCLNVIIFIPAIKCWNLIHLTRLFPVARNHGVGKCPYVGSAASTIFLSYELTILVFQRSGEINDRPCIACHVICNDIPVCGLCRQPVASWFCTITRPPRWKILSSIEHTRSSL